MPIAHCKKCDGKSFPDLHSLRVHQWKEHGDAYRVGLKKARQVRATKRTKNPASNNGHITAEQLLDRLKAQRTFMNDIVAMVEGLLKQE